MPYHSFTNDEALSSELSGYFYIAIDKKDTALQCLLHAHEKYQAWGAAAKRDALFQFVQAVFDPTCIAFDSVSSSYGHGAIEERNLPKNKRLL
jgi:hypothetical protein